MSLFEVKTIFKLSYVLYFKILIQLLRGKTNLPGISANLYFVQNQVHWQYATQLFNSNYYDIKSHLNIIIFLILIENNYIFNNKYFVSTIINSIL